MNDLNRQRGAWYVYDWANSAFATSVLTVFLGPYLISLAEAAADADGFIYPLGLRILPVAYYPFLVSASALLQVLAMPAVGALVDRTGRRRLLLGLTAEVGALATLGLYVVQGSAYLLGGALFLVASVAFACSVVVSNAFLPDLAGPDDRDAVSSRGWAVGYLGGGLLLVTNLALVLLADADRLPIDAADAVRICLASAGAWWAVFTLVPLAGLRDGLQANGGDRPRGGLGQLRATLRRLRGSPATLGFLVAFLLYNDGIQTVISQAAVFAVIELELGQAVVAGAVLVVQFVAVAGALLLGSLARSFGARRVVLASLVVWVVVLGAAFVLPAGAPAPFLALSAAIGLVLGGTQALSRSLFSHMVPRGAEAEYFSAYEVSDRGTSWLGPLLFGIAIQVTGSYRVAIVSLVVFFVVGFGLLAVSDIPRAAAEAGNPAPQRV